MSPLLKKLLSVALSALTLVWIISTYHSKPVPVVWSELYVLDALAEKAEGMVETHDVKALRVFGPALNEAAVKLNASRIPANAADPDATAELRNDLKNLANNLADPAKLSDSDLESFVAGVHPIVEQLMVKSGMPHVHESPPK